MKQACWLLLGALLFSCRPREKTSYAIADLPPALRPALTQIVTDGYVGFGDDIHFIQKQATTAQLRQMLHCEHPLLRAVAGRILLNRPDVDHFALVMDHLGDTAVVSVDMGEWGQIPRMVSDDLIFNARWKTEADRQKTIDAVILTHNNLRSAYTALSRVGAQEKYYPSIRAMAIRERLLYESEWSWYALAKYRKKEDIALLRDAFKSHLSVITDESLQLMEEFPDTAYLPLLQLYFRNYLVRHICKLSEWNPRVRFYQTIAVYKNDSSAAMLDTLLHRRPFMPCRVDTTDLREQLMTAIWDNPCPAYSALRKEIEKDMILKRQREWQRERMQRDYLLADTSVYVPLDTSKEQVRWF